MLPYLSGGGSASLNATEASIRNTRTGWLTRIMGAGGVTRQLAFSSVQGAPQVDTFRTCTPLRPNAGLVERVTTPGGSVVRPQTVPSPPPGVNKKDLVGDGPNSARGPGQLSKLQPPPSRSVRDSVFNSTAPDDPIVDPFAQHELALLRELNRCRADPTSYAAEFEARMSVASPFLSADAAPQTLLELKQTVQRLQAQVQEQQRVLDQLSAQSKKEVQSMKDAWVAEDAERAKKGKGKPAAAAAAKGKPGQPVPTEKQPEEIEADREEAVRQAGLRLAEKSVTVIEEKKRMEASADAASKGVKALESCLARLRMTAALPALAHNRGLGLTARDLCGLAPALSALDATFMEVAARYGHLTGAKGVSLVVEGRAAPPVQRTLFDMLLSLHDVTKLGRLALLSSDLTAAAFGWRRHPALNGRSCACFVGAQHYTELSAIADRDHLNLREVRRILPQAKAINDACVIRLKPDWNVQVVEPRTSPMLTKEGRIMVRVACDENIFLTANLAPFWDADPTAPSFVSGETLVQRVSSQYVEVLVCVPRSGKFKLHFFARSEASGNAATTTVAAAADSQLNATIGSETPASLNGTQSMIGGGARHVSSSNIVATSGSSRGLLTSSSMTVKPGTAAGVAAGGASVVVASSGGHSPTTSSRDGYTHIGNFTVDATLPVPYHADPLPAVSSDFSERRCQLISPQSANLPPDTDIVFHLIVPLYPYKAKEVARVQAVLERTTQQAEGTKDAEDDLGAAVQAATVQVQDAKTQQTSQLPGIQNDIAALTKELAKKKGKELDKAKVAVAELEDKISALEAAVVAAKANLAKATERLASHRRSTRQAVALRQRYLAEAEHLRELTDRTQPLNIELSVDDRRATMPAVNADGTEYRAKLHTPVTPCRICVFIAGVVLASFQVVEPFDL